MSYASEDVKEMDSDQNLAFSNDSSGYVSEEKLSTNSKEPEIFQKLDWSLQALPDDMPEEKLSDVNQMAKKTLVVFRWQGAGNSVSVAGSYDGWKEKTPLVKSESGFCTIIDVPTGAHEYSFIVDGERTCNPNEPKVSGKSGAENNMVTVKSSDCDVFEALDADSAGSNSGPRSGIVHGNWSNTVPPKPNGPCFFRSGPPQLPPHLLHSILNKDTPPNCDPTILQEPTHVVLNHLYTRSIKDGILVLGMTHRYRKKYVTTLLYRPS